MRPPRPVRSPSQRAQQAPNPAAQPRVPTRPGRWVGTSCVHTRLTKIRQDGIAGHPHALPTNVKFAYGLIGLAFFVFVAFWLVGSPANKFQVDETPIEAPAGVQDPVAAGEPIPYDFRQVLPRDAILPIYNPTFKTASAADWGDDVLVIGIELDGEAKAYPVSFLNRREMVIDWIGGTPILVSW